jgi:hypothetical protein
VALNPEVPVTLATEEGNLRLCAACINIYSDADIHYLEYEIPYFFPIENRIYVCDNTECHKRSSRIHSSTPRKGSKSSSDEGKSSSYHSTSSGEARKGSRGRGLIIVVGSDSTSSGVN